MLLLIDAYNLLHQSDAMQRGRGEGWLAKARDRLVSRLAEHLGPELSRQTCLVFDSRDAPSHLPSEFVRESIELRFAVDHDEADDLLEEIIARHPAPKRLMVISSDHRVQRAASRRGAKFVDSDQWYAALLETGPRLAIDWPPKRPGSQDSPISDKPEPPADEAELAAWIEEFGGSPIEVEPMAKPVKAKRVSAKPLPRTAKPLADAIQQPKQSKSANHAKRSPASDKPDPNQIIDADLANPFPKGYGEDLL